MLKSFVKSFKDKWIGGALSHGERLFLAKIYSNSIRFLKNIVSIFLDFKVSIPKSENWENWTCWFILFLTLILLVLSWWRTSSERTSLEDSAKKNYSLTLKWFRKIFNARRHLEIEVALNQKNGTQIFDFFQFSNKNHRWLSKSNLLFPAHFCPHANCFLVAFLCLLRSGMFESFESKLLILFGR